jgi:Reverse transcriptase (RNA-dependent DNA polymerase).
MLRRISERTLDMDEELCACFVDWMKAFDHVNWTKLMLILKGTGIDLRERKLISKLYVDQSVKMRLDQEETRSVTIGGGDREEWCVLPILFTLYSQYLKKVLLTGLETSNQEEK